MLERVIIYTIVIGFLITALLSPIMIPFLRKVKIWTKHSELGTKVSSKEIRNPDNGRCYDLIVNDCVTTIFVGNQFTSMHG